MSDHRQTDLVTLTRHVMAEQRAHPAASGELTFLLVSIQLACKFVATTVRKAGIVSLTGLAGSSNVQGEDQKKLDVIANEIFVNSIRSSGAVAIMVSEEDTEAIFVSPPSSVQVDGSSSPLAVRRKYTYAIVFDPLDGSSNIDAGVSIGSIFGIYRLQPNSAGNLSDVLRPGSQMVCAGYCVYGSSTILVLSTGGGMVNGYTLDTSIGEFILTDPQMRIPARGAIYSINEGNATKWTKPCMEYIQSVKFPAEPRKPYSLRYIGSMVADVHRTIKYGGVFAYPADKSNKSGKLRLLYECFPMAFIVEQAGGAAITGKVRVLDIQPKDIHERSPIYLGSREDIEEVKSFYDKYG
jgi:fructose-1,6-bisphosphatase I